MPGQPAADLFSNEIQIHQTSRTGRAFNFEVVSVVFDHGSENQHIDLNQIGPCQFGIASKHASVGLGGKLPDPELPTG